MAETNFHVFLSATSSEFGKGRAALAADLRSRQVAVKEQKDFRQEAGADTTLKKLHDYIRDCSAVVCIIGKRSGACPTPAAAARFKEMLPDGIIEASYTQWEFFFARFYRRRLSIYIAHDGYQPDKPTGEDRPGLQDALLHYIVDDLDLDRDYFSNEDQLCRLVLKEDWLRHASDKPMVLPYPSLGALFKGREEFINQLRASLAGGGVAGVKQTAISSQAVYGLGGIGKTRAAVEYAHAYAGEYAAIFLVVAESAEALNRNLAALAERLGLPETQATEEARRVAGVAAWLNANPGWLLILDNLDSPEALRAATQLTAALQGGHVLITSRLGNFPQGVRKLELDTLPIDDAAAFLLERTEGARRPAPDDEAAARELAEALGGLALALEHAGAYIAARRETLRGYLSLWRSGNDAVMAWCDPNVSNYERTTAATLQLSIEKLTPEGRALLERVAFLAPEPIPESLLDVPIPGTSPDEMKAALADLAAYSLARRDDDPSSFTVHRLVQELTRRALDSKAAGTRLNEALNWIDDAFVGDPYDVRSWPIVDPLAAHARATAERGDAANIAEPPARLMNQLALLLQGKARYAEAEPLLRRTLAINEASRGMEHPIVSTCLNNLGELLKVTNRLAEAEPLYRRALTIDERSYGLDHPEVATDLRNLGGVLRATGRLAEAESLVRRALAIDERSYGVDAPEIGIDLNNLAALLQETNRLVEAEPLFRRALAIGERSLGADHPDTALRLVNLAALLGATNRLAEAESLSRRALEILKNSYGPEHPDFASALAILASIMKATNRLAEAEPIWCRAVTIFIEFERRNGHPHPHHDAAIRNYVGMLREMGKNQTDIDLAMATLRCGHSP